MGKNKQYEAKVRRLKTGKITELQKRLKEKDNEIDVLKDMVVSGKKEVKSREITINKLKKRTGKLEKITGVRAQRVGVGSEI